MNHIQFTVVRFLSIPLALLFSLDWALLPSNLRTTKAIEQVVHAKYGKFKGREVVYLRAQAGNEQRVECGSAGPLCTYLRQGPVPDLRVWLQEPALVHEPWIVAAESHGKVIVKPEDSRSAYREFKVVWAVVSLFLVSVAFISWYFAPFSREAENAA